MYTFILSNVWILLLFLETLKTFQLLSIVLAELINVSVYNPIAEYFPIRTHWGGSSVVGYAFPTFSSAPAGLQIYPEFHHPPTGSASAGH